MFRYVCLLFITFFWLFSTGVWAADQTAATYRCPPCGCDSDQKVFSEPGKCPSCVDIDMVLAEARLNVAIFVFNKIQILDFSGPMDVFATNTRHFYPYTVGLTTEPIVTTGGMSVNPKYSFADAPLADILIIPGGSVGDELAKEAVIDWIRKSAANAKHVLSVCTGSFLLAKAGLLDGLTTTTYHSAIPGMKSFSNKYKVISDQRYVDNGKVICSAGISSGIDASFHLVTKILGMGEAQKIALDLEYDWQPDGKYIRATLADQHLPKIDLPRHTQFKITKTQGNRDHWVIAGNFALDMSVEDLSSFLERQFKDDGVTNLQISKESERITFKWVKQTASQNWNGLLWVEAKGKGRFQSLISQKKSIP